MLEEGKSSSHDQTRRFNAASVNGLKARPDKGSGECAFPSAKALGWYEDVIDDPNVMRPNSDRISGSVSVWSILNATIQHCHPRESRDRPCKPYGLAALLPSAVASPLLARSRLRGNDNLVLSVYMGNECSN
jgi:hypothetical protein